MVDPVPTPSWADIVRETEQRGPEPVRDGHDTASLVAAFPELGAVHDEAPPGSTARTDPSPARLYLPARPARGCRPRVGARRGLHLGRPGHAGVELGGARPGRARDHRPVPRLPQGAARRPPPGALRRRARRLDLGGRSTPTCWASRRTGCTWAARARAPTSPAGSRSGSATRAGRSPRSLVLAYPTMHADLPDPSPELAATLAAWPGYDPTLPAIARDVNLNHVGTRPA